MSRTATIKVKIEKIFYTYHPDFIEDENEPRGYRILGTGKWVVEWGVRYKPRANLPTCVHHFTANCATEEDAIHFASLLRRNQTENSPWATVKKDDICLHSCVCKNEKIRRR